MTNNNITCLPLNNTSKRFLLGKKGNKELLAIGLNPSTASEVGLDPTSRNIEKIAHMHGCDGWWLINLYPLRTSKPKNLPIKGDPSLSQENIAFVQNMLADSSYKISKVLCCWGNNIDDFKYLKEYANQILDLLDSKSLKLYCIAMTKSGNPFHPSPTPVNRFLGGIDKIRLNPYERK